VAEVRWSLAAEQDLQAIELFIARDSLLRAATFVDRLIQPADVLEHTPLLGRVVPEFNDQQLRELIFRGYRLVYVHREDRAEILRVVHGARDLRELYRREPWLIG
jgi:plasmid stabilization system protein ParE